MAVRLILLPLLALALALGCARSGFGPRPCAGQQCSGHGICGVKPDGAPMCACDPGWRNRGPLACEAERSGPARQDGGTDAASDAGPQVYDFEGQFDHPSCSNGLDDDGDGHVDLAELACWVPVCSQHGWCWANPLPWGNRPMPEIHAMWGRSDGDLWAAGDLGLILHWDGSAWTSFRTPIEGIVFGLHGFAADDIWACGTHAQIGRWNGTTWSLVHTDALDVSLLAIWGPDPGHLWAVGEEGALLRLESGGWRAEQLDPALRLTAVWGVSQDEVWVLGLDSDAPATVALSWDGTSWARVTLSDVALGGVMRGFAADDLWATTGAQLLRWDGVGWSLQAQAPSTGTVLASIAGSSGQELWLGARRQLLRWDGARLGAVSSELRYSVAALWAGEDTVWGAGGGLALLSDGVLRDLGEQDLSFYRLNGVWGADGEQVWAVGIDESPDSSFQNALVWDGSAWSRVPVPGGGELTAVAGSARDEVWAVGTRGWVLRWNGATWTQAHDAGVRLEDVWAAPGQAWAVGAAGLVLRWDGASWGALAAPTTAQLTSVHGTGLGEVWIGGYNGTLLSYDGVTFSANTISSTYPISDIWGPDPDRVYAAAGDAGLLRWDRDSGVWAPEPVAAGATIHCVGGLDRAHVWAFLTNGDVFSYSMLRWDGTAWSDERLPPDGALAALWGVGDRVWGVAHHGTILYRDR